MPETSVALSVSHRAKCNHVSTYVPVYVFMCICIYSMSVIVHTFLTYIW